MTSENLDPREKEKQFNEFLVREYLKYGAVDGVYRAHEYDLPISYPSFQRLLDKWGIVKSAGPNRLLSEAICLVASINQEKLPVEKIYRMLPPSFRTSLSTAHRIASNVKEGIIRRAGTALVINLENRDDLILVGKDVSTPRGRAGKEFGDISLPMT